MVQYNQVMLAGSSLSGNQTSNPFSLIDVVSYAVQIVWAGNAVGTFDIQSSIDLGNTSTTIPTGINNWFTIPDASLAVNNNSGVYTYNAACFGLRWVRFVFTYSSGSGTITGVTFNAKSN